MKFSAILILTVALILESSVTTLPLILIALLCFLVLLKDNQIFFLAFIFGLFLDLAYFKTPGISSAYLVIFLFLVLLYQKKFEIATSYFVFISSFLGSLGFLLISGYTNSIFPESITASVIGVILFKTLQKFKIS